VEPGAYLATMLDELPGYEELQEAVVVVLWRCATDERKFGASFW
jgi:hypothetical protein